MNRSDLSQAFENLDYENPEKCNKEDQTTKVPMLYVDVNLGSGKNERIVVYDGDKS